MQSGIVKTLFIINPILEKQNGKNIAELIAKHLDPERFESTILYSEYSGHAEILASQHLDRYHLLVAGGGDGTINQVARSLVHTDKVLGILPMGSGKGLARSLHIPLNLRAAIKVINRMHISSIDTGVIDNQRFVNIAGIGFAAQVAHSYAVSGKRGFLSYASNMLRSIPKYSPATAEITIDDRSIRDRYFIISIANASQWGYGAHISPTSKYDDGLLDICLLKKFPRIRTLGLLIRLYVKTIHRSKYLDTIPVKKAVISGDGPFTGHIDGEPVEFNTPAVVYIEPGSLKVVI